MAKAMKDKPPMKGKKGKATRKMAMGRKDKMGRTG